MELERPRLGAFRALRETDALPLGHDIVHSLVRLFNPIAPEAALAFQ
jgi:hypothetical protein